MNHLPSLNAVDIAALVIMALSAIQGFRRGLAGEVGQLFSVVLSLGLGLFFYHPLARYLTEHTRLEERGAATLAFILIAVGVLAAMFILRILLSKLIKLSAEKTVDKAGGVLVGLLSACVFVYLVFFAMNLWPNDYLNRHFGETSCIGRLVRKTMPAVQEKAVDLPSADEISKKIDTLNGG